MIDAVITYTFGDESHTAAVARWSSIDGPTINRDVDFFSYESVRYFIDPKEEFLEIARDLLTCGSEDEFYNTLHDIDRRSRRYSVTIVEMSDEDSGTRINDGCGCDDSCNCGDGDDRCNCGEKVYPVFIYDAVDDNVVGISGIYRTMDDALAALQNNFDKGFIDCTNIIGIYKNCEGELLIPQEYDLLSA